MANAIRIWEIDDSSKAASPLKATDRMETEDSLEEVLVQNPDVLMPDLTLVGRQTQTESGVLDLLGVDAHGRLVVFELKRERLTREAVAQIIDYCSYLESLPEADLARYIADHSGRSGIDKIDDFEAWYSDRQGGKELRELRPMRMVLVGLGVDTKATRMVEFLTERGVDISLLTFHGYQYEGRTLLARQEERGADAADVGGQRRPTDAVLRKAHAERAKELGIEGLWQEALSALSIGSSGKALKSGVTFYLPRITLPENVNVHGSHSLVIDSSDKMRVTFFPAAVHVCSERFEEQRSAIPFEFEKPPNAPTTDRFSEQWYCELNSEIWKKHREALTTLTRQVHEAWEEFRRGGTRPESGDGC